MLDAEEWECLCLCFVFVLALVALLPVTSRLNEAGSGASNTVTAVKAPPGVNGNAVVDMLRDEYDVELAGGQGPFAGKIFRIGHLGWVNEKDIDIVLDALRAALPRLGHKVSVGASR